MTTLLDLINILRANAGDRPVIDTVTGTGSGGAVLVSDTTLTFASGANIAPKTILDFDDSTFESSLIQAKPTITTATVVRGSDSTAAAHAANAVVRASPRYRAVEYREAINQALKAISASWGRSNWDSTQGFSSTASIIPVPAACMRSPEVWRQPDVTTSSLARVPSTWMRTCPSAFSATGQAVRLLVRPPSSGVVYLNYEDPWPTLTNYSDTLDPDFPENGYDCIIMGAEAYLEDTDAWGVLAYQEPHIKARQFGSQLNDIRMATQSTLQRFIQRRTELGAVRPKRSASWMRG